MSTNVLALGPLPPPYHGVATFLRDLLQHGGDGRVRLAHLDTSDHRDAANLGKWDPTNVSVGFSNLAQLASRCSREEIDVVYLPLSQAAPAFMRDALFILQAKALGKRVVIHLHGGYFRTLFDESGALFQNFARAALSCVSAAVVLGEDFRPIFAGLIPEEHIHVVENGVVDFPDSSEGSQARNANCLLYMGTLTRTKGILELIEATALLRESHRNIRLKIAGLWADEALRAEGEALIGRLNLSSHVEFCGVVEGESKREFLQCGGIFCLPTRYPFEGQPLVILEAMAAGLPVLSTRHGVIPSTVIDGETGRLVARDSSAPALAEALHPMLGDENKLREWGSAGRRRYLERYTLDACHRRLFDVFEKVNR